MAEVCSLPRTRPWPTSRGIFDLALVSDRSPRASPGSGLLGGLALEGSSAGGAQAGAKPLPTRPAQGGRGQRPPAPSRQPQAASPRPPDFCPGLLARPHGNPRLRRGAGLAEDRRPRRSARPPCTPLPPARSQIGPCQPRPRPSAARRPRAALPLPEPSHGRRLSRYAPARPGIPRRGRPAVPGAGVRVGGGAALEDRRKRSRPRSQARRGRAGRS
jgi:hypothetical protein